VLWRSFLARRLREGVPYDPTISATGYVSKYVTKDFGDWDLIGNFIPMVNGQLSLLGSARKENSYVPKNP
jgi:hypothetical protein